MTRVVLASSNQGKLREIQAVLAPFAMELLPQSDFAVTDAEETGLSFVENAIIKARHAATVTGLPALADDSGLAVDALDGRPGIYSARFAGPNATDLDNNFKLLASLANVPAEQRTAQFHCVLVYLRHAEDPVPLIAHGSWAGQILTQPRGDNGFGYDPLFYLPELDCASAELAPEQKNRVSHRALALQEMAHLLGH